MFYTGVRSIPTAKRDTDRTEHLPEEALPDSVLSHKESLLEHGRKKQTFHTRSQEWQF